MHDPIEQKGGENSKDEMLAKRKKKSLRKKNILIETSLCFFEELDTLSSDQRCVGFHAC